MLFGCNFTELVRLVFLQRPIEEVILGKREIYVHYGDGMGTSTLKVPGEQLGTGRNMNTVAKMATLAAARCAALKVSRRYRPPAPGREK